MPNGRGAVIDTSDNGHGNRDFQAQQGKLDRENQAKSRRIIISASTADAELHDTWEVMGERVRRLCARALCALDQDTKGVLDREKVTILAQLATIVRGNLAKTGTDPSNGLDDDERAALIE